MSKHSDGGHAFPVVELDRVTGGVCDQHFGMSLRDYFAAKAMHAMASFDVQFKADAIDDETNRVYSSLAEHAYLMADAMLAARAAPQEPAR
jgi:hypothetical protein